MKSKVFTKVMDLLYGSGTELDKLKAQEDKCRASYAGEMLQEELKKISQASADVQPRTKEALTQAINDFLTMSNEKVEKMLTGDKMHSDLALLSGALDLAEDEIAILKERHKGNDIMTSALRKYATAHDMEIAFTFDSSLREKLQRVTPVLRTAVTYVGNGLGTAIYESTVSEIDELAAELEG